MPKRDATVPFFMCCPPAAATAAAVVAAVVAEGAEGEDWKSPHAAAAVAAVAERSLSASHKLRADKHLDECTVFQCIQYPAVA